MVIAFFLVAAYIGMTDAGSRLLPPPSGPQATVPAEAAKPAFARVETATRDDGFREDRRR